MAIDTTMRAAPVRQRGIARWTRLGMLGQSFVIAGALTLLAAILGFGLTPGGEIGFLAIVCVVAVVGIVAARRLGTLGKVIGIVTALLTAAALFWTAFGLFAFPSFFDVLPGVLVIPGALLAVTSYIAAIVAGRREHVTPVVAGRERTAIRAAVAVVGVVAIVTGALTFVGRSSVDGARADAAVTLGDFEFDEDTYELAAKATVHVKNTDPVFHTFTIDDLGVDLSLMPGEEALVQLPDDVGTFVLYCRPHTMNVDAPEDGDMAATLRVA